MTPVAQYVAQVGNASKVLIAAALVAAGAAAGSWITAQVKNAQLAELRTEQAERVARAETLARQRLQAAQARGDELTVQLTAANQAAADLRKELDDALSKVTTGRPCLGGAALRVLDRAPGIAPAGLPAPASVAAGADAGHPAAPAAQPAGDEGDAATDTDVARWALHAAGEYGECTRRLGALIDWHDER